MSRNKLPLRTNKIVEWKDRRCVLQTKQHYYSRDTRSVFHMPAEECSRSLRQQPSSQYPAQLAEWIIKLLCPKSGVVLDRFMGAGSTAEGVLRAGGERKYVGIDINAQYCSEAEARIKHSRGIRQISNSPSGRA